MHLKSQKDKTNSTTKSAQTTISADTQTTSLSTGKEKQSCTGCSAAKESKTSTKTTTNVTWWDVGLVIAAGAIIAVCGEIVL